MVRRFVLAIVAALLLGGGCGFWILGPAGQTASAVAARAAEPQTYKDAELFIYVPASVSRTSPAQIIVAMHGMGGDGPSFCQNLLAAAERHGWVVVAPTFKYQDYMNPALVVQDDTTFLPRLKAMLDSVPARTGLVTREKVLMYGFSRGGQAVHRFATLYPERVLAVVAAAAGSYTLPLHTMLVDGRSQTLPLPYGVADMPTRVGHEFNYEAFKGVAFRVAVGGADGNANETPRAWDPYIGRDRITRARTYAQTLQAIGVEADLAVYPGVGHYASQQMLDDSFGFLAAAVDKRAIRYGHAPARATGAFASVVTATVARNPR